MKISFVFVSMFALCLALCLGSCAKQPAQRTQYSALLDQRMDIDSFFLSGSRLEELDAIRSSGLEPVIDSITTGEGTEYEEKLPVIAVRNVSVFGIDSGYFCADIASKVSPLLWARFDKARLPRSRWATIRDSFDRARNGDGWCKIVNEDGQEVLRGEVTLAHSKMMLRCDTSGMMLSFFIKGGFNGIE
jgi:hypothetical protein